MTKPSPRRPRVLRPRGRRPHVAPVYRCGFLKESPRWIPATFRHATSIRLGGKPTVVEVFTVEEMNRLPLAARPAAVHTLPGIGYLAFRAPSCNDELIDIDIVAQVASNAMWVRGKPARV
jgi:hypothetical protein